MGMILRIASSRIVGQGDIVGRSGYFSLNLSANSVMRGRLDARRTLKSLVADLRNDWLAITGALRDWKLSAGIHILCKPQNARKENASADSVENENERKQVDWLEKRIVQCTAKSVERTALVSRSTSYMALSSL